MPHILLVEDDPKIASFLTQEFGENGCSVDCFENGEKALILGGRRDYAAAVVDLMLPGIDGLSVIEGLRKAGRQFPIIVLSAKRGVEERAVCLQRGADDYLGKPFSFSELLARVQSAVGRAQGDSEPTRLIVGDLLLDRFSHEVTRASKRIVLTPLEFSLLEQLMLHAGRTMSKGILQEWLFGNEFAAPPSVLDSLVVRLSGKLEEGFSATMIHSIRGIGYMLKPGREVPGA